jgi:acyl-CoA-binding protein
MPETTSAKPNTSNDQLLHLVFGGELTSLDDARFKDPGALDIIGVFPNYARAREAWKSAAQKTVDNAQMRYFIVHIHKLLDPSAADKTKA